RTSTQLIKHLYDDYKSFCMEDGFKPVNKTNFKKRLEASNIEVKRINVGNVAYLSGGTSLNYSVR
ncbi:MAG: winged helix-turn-helix domain-containing protein, partial [Candidatus Marinimicrobia bacterium]|nr:winged helix-turn-helix domain-containing protein [Candidatus Neomarinimicrobiota bacterium]